MSRIASFNSPDYVLVRSAPKENGGMGGTTAGMSDGERLTANLLVALEIEQG